jgi:hypothetical protein
MVEREQGPEGSQGAAQPRRAEVAPTRRWLHLRWAGAKTLDLAQCPAPRPPFVSVAMAIGSESSPPPPRKLAHALQAPAPQLRQPRASTLLRKSVAPPRSAACTRPLEPMMWSDSMVRQRH